VAKSADAISRVLEAEAFPGTLNAVAQAPYRLLKGTALDEKGKYRAVPAVINGTPCLLSTGASFPFHVFEIIAAVPLRQTLGLQDGASVTLTAGANNISPVTGWREKLWSRLYSGREEVYYKPEAFSRLMKSFWFRHAHRWVVQGRVKGVA